MKNINNNIVEISLPKLDKHTKLNPDFVTGLVEAEGSFSITKHKDNRARQKMTIGLRFEISMLSNEIDLLFLVKDFFGCGNIVLDHRKDSSIPFVRLRILDIKSINNIVISHFTNYPLRGTKHLDFLTFKKAVNLINSKKHLVKEGIDDIVEMSYNMNSYRKFPVEYSPIHTIEGNSEYIPISGHYINGFIAGDGCLALKIRDSDFGRMTLQISQHKNNKLLLLSIANYFESPNKVYYQDTDSLQITLSGHKLWQNIIFNHFSQYPLHGTKVIKLNKLFLIRELMLNNNHLMQVGRSRHWKPDIKLQIKDIWNN